MASNPPTNRWARTANTSQSRSQEPNSKPTSRDRASLANSSRSAVKPSAPSPAPPSVTPTPAPIPTSNPWADRGRASGAGKQVVVGNGTATSTSTTSGTSSGKGTSASTSVAAGAAPSTSGPSTSVHTERTINVNGFNADEVMDYLRKGYQAAISGDASNHSRYQDASTDTAATRPAWGSKPSTMANGADFWVQLRRQILTKESGG